MVTGGEGAGDTVLAEQAVPEAVTGLFVLGPVGLKILPELRR